MSQAEKEPETSELILKSKSHASSFLTNYHFNTVLPFYIFGCQGPLAWQSSKSYP